MRRFINPFTVIFTLLLGLTYHYLDSRMGTTRLDSFLLAIPMIFIWITPLFLWSSTADQFTPFQLLLQRLTFLSMGLLSFLLTANALQDLLILGSRNVSAQMITVNFETSSPTGVLILSLGLLSLGIYRAFYSFRVDRVSFQIPHLPNTFPPLKIAQISDLHVGAQIQKGYVQSVVDRVNALQPDLIALTGDIFDGNYLDILEDIEPLKKLSAPLGVYFVMGNHEYYWDPEQFIKFLKASHIQVLLNSHQIISHQSFRIAISGVIDPAARRITQQDLGPDLSLASQFKESPHLTILLAHQPNIAEKAADYPFDLQLSGHTHGGQFFPWTLVARLFHRFYVGKHRLKNLWIYVNTGAGFWGPPVRLGTTPSIGWIEIQGSKPSSPSQAP